MGHVREEEASSAAGVCQCIGLGSGTAHYWITILIFIFLGVPHNRKEWLSFTADPERNKCHIAELPFSDPSMLPHVRVQPADEGTYQQLYSR